MPFNTTVAVTYANSHGLHLLRSHDINAPLPGDLQSRHPRQRRVPARQTGSGRSDGVLRPVQPESADPERELKGEQNLSLTGSYAYGHAMSNTDGLGTFPANPYSMEGEYGPAAIDMRHRISLSGTITVKWGIRFNPLLHRRYGTAIRHYRRPGPLRRHALQRQARNRHRSRQTRRGERRPTAYSTRIRRLGQQLLPRNFGRGPGQIMLNMRVGRTFTFGSREGRAPVATNPGGVSGGPGGGPAAAGNRAAHSHWVVRVPAPPRRTDATAWLSRCRFATSRITTIQDRSSATSRPRCSARPTNPPAPADCSRKARTTGDWSCRRGSHFDQSRPRYFVRRPQLRPEVGRLPSSRHNGLLGSILGVAASAFGAEAFRR